MTIFETKISVKFHANTTREATSKCDDMVESLHKNFEDVSDMKRETVLQQLTPIDQLRNIVSAMNSLREDFVQKFSIDQLIQLHKMWQASEWDIGPDEWSQYQIVHALIYNQPPRFNDDESPMEK